MATRKHGRSIKSRRGFWRRLLHALPLIVVVSAVTWFADHRLHLLDSLHFFAVDLFVASAAPPSSHTVVIVNISDDDYREMFGARSPLDPKTLEQVIRSVVKAKPAVIAVDVSTGDPGDASLLSDLRGADVPIVWARDAFAPDPEAHRPRWELDRVLGTAAPPADIRVGLSLFPRDADRFVRGYYRIAPGLERPSLAWATLEAYCADATRGDCRRVHEHEAAESSRHADSGEGVAFNFAADRYTFPKVSASAAAAAPESVFKAHIVIVGGTFAAGRDTYVTPLGDMAGVDLTARAIESELQGGGLTELSTVLMFLMDLLGGIALVYLNWRWAPGSRLNALVTAAAILVFAMVASYVAFRALNYWASFVPVGVGVWLHEAYDRAREADAMRRELEERRNVT